MIEKLIISLEISLVPNLGANLIIIRACLIYLLFKHINLQKLFFIIYHSFICSFRSFYYNLLLHSQSQSLSSLCLIYENLHAYVFLGAAFTETTSFLTLARSLEQNFKLPSKFAYGTLAAFNVIPKIHAEVNRIRLVGDMRHYHLSFYSPALYFKSNFSRNFLV